MTQSDEDFREEYKPLQIPAAYHPDDTQENKIIYALAQLSTGTDAEVVDKLQSLEAGIKSEQLIAITDQALKHLYEKGLIKGEDIQGEMHYNLSKVTQPNEGSVDPDLLAPGLD